MEQQFEWLTRPVLLQLYFLSQSSISSWIFTYCFRFNLLLFLCPFFGQYIVDQLVSLNLLCNLLVLSSFSFSSLFLVRAGLALRNATSCSFYALDLTAHSYKASSIASFAILIEALILLMSSLTRSKKNIVFCILAIHPISTF